MAAHLGSAHVQIRWKAHFATGWMYHVEVGDTRIWVDDAEMKQHHPDAVAHYNQTIKKRHVKQRAAQGAANVRHEKRAQYHSKNTMASTVGRLGELVEE